MAGTGQGARWEDLFDHLQVGDVVSGTVSGLTSYGAFVQIGDAPDRHPFGDALIHVSELSWEPIRQVTDVVRLGDRVAVKVIRLDYGRNQILLSLRQASGHEQSNDPSA